MPVDANEKLEDASVQYGDWTGTAAADDHDNGFDRALELLGFDSTRWWVLSVDIYGADLDQDGLYVYALDRVATGVENYEQLQAFARKNGEIPVTSFYVHGVSVATLVVELFKRFAVNLRSRSLEPGAALRIVSRDDVNYRDE